jgi:hypothetical protein
MHMDGIFRMVLIAATAMFSLVSAGAADAPVTPAERAARLESARAEIALTRTNIVFTMEQLDQVRRVEDPHAQFELFVAQFQKMKERAKLTQETARAMKAKGDAYFARWEPQTGTESDADARRKAEATQAQRKAVYERIIQQMQLARTNFTPLLEELEQIKTILEGERSKEQVAAAKDLFMQANWHCVTVQRALMEAERQLASLASGFAGDDKGSSAEGKKP